MAEKYIRILNRMMAIAFFLMMLIAFYATAEYQGGLPVLPMAMRYMANVVVIAMGILWVFITLDFPRIQFVYSVAFIMMVPLIGIQVISMGIWVITCQETSFVTRGTANVVYLFLNILCAASGYYMFGKRAVSYMLYAASATVSIIILDVMRRYGAADFITQYIALVTTFADNTGPLMEKIELHDLTQGLGVFVMYYLYCVKNRQLHLFDLTCAVFFFSTGLKRIDVLAMMLAGTVGIVYDLLAEKWKTYMLIFMVSFMFVFSYAYLVLIKEDLYQPLMDYFGINTMSRGYIYRFYKDYFELSPSFLGRGIRFIYKINENYKKTKIGVRVPAMAHNDIMSHFIELGFWGFIFWLWSNTWYKVSAVRKKFGSKASTFMLLTVIYSFITFTTDNTYFYYSINIVAHITVIAYVDEHRKISQEVNRYDK